MLFSEHCGATERHVCTVRPPPRICTQVGLGYSGRLRRTSLGTPTCVEGTTRDKGWIAGREGGGLGLFEFG